MVDLAVRHGWAQGANVVAKLEQKKLISGGLLWYRFMYTGLQSLLKGDREGEKWSSSEVWLGTGREC